MKVSYCIIQNELFKLYNKLILTRQHINTGKNSYYEVHHILPKCLGGSDKSSNLVKLTPREHYLAHWVLTKLYPTNYKIWLAFSLMSGKLSPKSKRVFTAAAYARCKQAASTAIKLKYATGWNPMKGKEARKKISDRMKKDNPIAKDPSLNWTARTVSVYFKDGSIQHFDYGTLAAKTLGIPYSTWKWALKNNNGKIPKFNIVKIIQGKPKDTNNKSIKAARGKYGTL